MAPQMTHQTPAILGKVSRHQLPLSKIHGEATPQQQAITTNLAQESTMVRMIMGFTLKTPHRWKNTATMRTRIDNSGHRWRTPTATWTRSPETRPVAFSESLTGMVGKQFLSTAKKCSQSSSEKKSKRTREASCIKSLNKFSRKLMVKWPCWTVIIVEVLQ